MNEKIYELVTMDSNGKIHQTMTDLKSLDSLVSGIETSTRLRPELQGQPKLHGYLGPMWGGQMYDVEGDLKPSWAVVHKDYYKAYDVIRYETERVYNAMCI